MAFPTPQEFKVVVVGEKSVGKTSLVLRFIDGCFQPQQQPTIGAFFFSKHLVLAGGAACVLQVWDTAGQERFRAITPMYYRQAMGAIVCFDVTSEASFETMQGWVKELRENTEPGSIVIAIAATKADLEAARVVGVHCASDPALGSFLAASLCFRVPPPSVPLKGDFSVQIRRALACMQRRSERCTQRRVQRQM